MSSSELSSYLCFHFFVNKDAWNKQRRMRFFSTIQNLGKFTFEKQVCSLIGIADIFPFSHGVGVLESCCSCWKSDFNQRVLQIVDAQLEIGRFRIHVELSKFEVPGNYRKFDPAACKSISK
jgi:hypothetical protein